MNPKSDFHALRCLYARWVKLDAQAAWASFRQSSIPLHSTHFYMSGDEGESSGLGYSRLHHEPRSLIAGRMLAAWKHVDPDAAEAFAAKLMVPGSPEGEGISIKSYELKRATGEDPAGEEDANRSTAALSEAATQALALTDSGSRKKALDSATARWMEKDTAAACRWIQQLPPDQRASLSFGQLRWPMRSAPAALRAETLTAMLQDRSLTAEDLARIAGNTSKRYYDFNGEPQGAFNAAEAVREWAGQDPPAARRFVESLPENDLKALLVGEAAGALARTDVETAVALLNQTGGDQEIALRGFMRGWAETNVRASLEWAGRIEDSATRDACLDTIATTLAGSDSALALETARTIGDPTIRQRIHQTVRRSLSWNPAALQQMQAQFPGDDWNTPVR